MGQFDILVDGEIVASRGGNPLTRFVFGAGFPEPEEVIADLERRRG